MLIKLLSLSNLCVDRSLINLVKREFFYPQTRLNVGGKVVVEEEETKKTDQEEDGIRTSKREKKREAVT